MQYADHDFRVRWFRRTTGRRLGTTDVRSWARWEHGSQAFGGFRGRDWWDDREDFRRGAGGFGLGAFAGYPIPDARHADGAALYLPVVLGVAEDERDDQHYRHRQAGEHGQYAAVHRSGGSGGPVVSAGAGGGSFSA
jgi:hypothetical protein